MTLFDLLDQFFLEDLQVLIPLIRCLLDLFKVHVQGLRVALDLLNSFYDFLFEDLLSLLHLMYLSVQGLILRRRRGTSGVLGGGRL